jgi:hypothetical protein
MSEERKVWAKELSIARQSAIKISLEFCKVHGIIPTLKELIRLTDVLAEDCILIPNDEFKKTIEKVDKWVIDKKAEAKK